MDNEITKIPTRLVVGGHMLEVRRVDSLFDFCLGEVSVVEGEILIADKCGRDRLQGESSKRVTFFHELVHAILYVMGEKELEGNERFVCAFSSLLKSALESMEYESTDKPKED